MTIPDWFCPVVCAGLATNELMPSQPLERKINMHIKHINQTFRFKEKSRWNKTDVKREKVEFNDDNVIDVSNFEENEHITRPTEETKDP